MFAYKSDGKRTYYVRGQRFFNDSGMRNGKDLALAYCKANFIDESEIIVFDSILECNRYEFLKEQEKQGVIKDLRHHQLLPILSSYKNYNGDVIPALNFEADFAYINVRTGEHCVEDVKGASLFEDSRFEAIKQIFDYKYREKTYCKIILWRDKQWVEWKLGERKKPRKLIQKQKEAIRELQKQVHDKTLAENKKTREIARLRQLKAIVESGGKLSKQQRERLEALSKTYEI